MKLRKLLLLMDCPQPIKVVTDLDGQGEADVVIFRGDSKKVSATNGEWKVVRLSHLEDCIEIEVR